VGLIYRDQPPQMLSNERSSNEDDVCSRIYYCRGLECRHPVLLFLTHKKYNMSMSDFHIVVFWVMPYVALLMGTSVIGEYTRISPS
jgi:hypothetical protein